MKKVFFGILIISLCFSGCSPRQARAGTGGAAIGAVSGAVIGDQSGHSGEGALIGATAGAATGVLVADSLETKDQKIASQKEIIRRQQEEKLRQEREYQDLQRQEHYNNRLKAYEAE